MAKKSYELTIDPKGVIVGLKVGGKPYSMRGLNKAQTVKYWRLFDEGGIVRGVELDGFQMSILSFVKLWETRYQAEMGTTLAGAPIQTFDDMRYLFMAIDSDAYMTILD